MGGSRDVTKFKMESSNGDERYVTGGEFKNLDHSGSGESRRETKRERMQPRVARRWEIDTECWGARAESRSAEIRAQKRGSFRVRRSVSWIAVKVRRRFFLPILARSGPRKRQRSRAASTVGWAVWARSAAVTFKGS
jgi:hypothetical protein